jgi:hypothetical protein
MAELREWKPTLRQKTQSAIQRGLEAVGLDRGTARRYGYNIAGGQGSDMAGMGLLDLTPVGLAYGMQEGAQAVNRGRQIGGLEGALEGGMGLLEVGLNALPAAAATRPLVRSARQAMQATPPVGALAPAQFVGKPLEGMPTKVKVGDKVEEFGTDQRLVDLAEQYAADRGLVYVPQPRYADVDPERAKRIADAYEAMQHAPNDPAVREAYQALADETMAQYDTLRRAGYQFDFYPPSGDPYGNPRNAINDVVTNQRLLVYPTETGFGGSTTGVGANNPLMQKTGDKWGGKDVLVNDAFRAVHDVFGHAKHGVGFRAGGEENAWQAHARMFSPKALPAATAETRGQNSWVNFGPFAQFNRTASPEATEYAMQKAGRLPDWVMTEGLLK